MQRAKVVAGSVVLREAAARWQAEYTKRVDTAVEVSGVLHSPLLIVCSLCLSGTDG